MPSFGTPGAIRAVPPQSAHLGQGVSYPIEIDTSGRLSLSFGQKAVEDALASIVQTAPGERVMQPDYGAQPFLFDPVAPARAQSLLQQVINEHEPRVATARLDGPVIVEPPGGVSGTIVYSLAAQATSANLTYPFFVGPTGS